MRTPEEREERAYEIGHIDAVRGARHHLQEMEIEPLVNPFSVNRLLPAEIDEELKQRRKRWEASMANKSMKDKSMRSMALVRLKNTAAHLVATAQLPHPESAADKMELGHIILDILRENEQLRGPLDNGGAKGV